MPRYFIELSYDGTAYNGWQVQENTSRTIQGILNEKISLVLNDKVDIVGAGRTDTGVHARKMVAHLDLPKRLTPKEEKDKLFKFNRILPDDISVNNLFPVIDSAHARFSAISRTYQYLIKKRKDPFYINKAHYLYGNIDVKKMNIAAKHLLNYNDFSSFSKSNTQVNNNNCTLLEAVWQEKEDVLLFNISADRFLRNMVRAIVGTLLDIGMGKHDPDDIVAIVETKNRSEAGVSVPACGLYLTSIKYPQNIFIYER